MNILRKRVYLSVITKRLSSFTRFHGLGDLPPICCRCGFQRPATTTLSRVQSAARYQRDICSAAKLEPQPSGVGCSASSSVNPHRRRLSRCSAAVISATAATIARVVQKTSVRSLTSDNCHPVYARNNLSQVHFRTLSSAVMSTQKKVCIVGSGNWGSAIARIVGFNAKRQPNLHETVTMYVYEEMIDGRKLTEIINETHENVKYLPGYQIPPNVVAVPDLVEAAKDADILIFVVPHQFIQRICSTLLGKIKATACGLSLIKGFERAEGGGIELISHNIQKLLGIPVSVLMGANIAQEVAAENFCETTIGCKDKEMAPIFQDLIQTDNFRVVVVDDVDAVEVCGALKNVVAVGAGIVDGLKMGDNTKAAVIRLGLMEMIKFIDVFYPGSKLSTFFESCGVADLVTTCYGGRNRRVAEAFVTSGKTIDELEKELLNGQKLQGPITAEEVNCMLKQKDMEDRFPLMTAVHRICKGEVKPEHLIDSMRAHPEHMKSSKGKVHIRSSL